METRVKLLVGDYSGDGHNITQDYYVLTNLSCKQVQSSYKEGTKKIGFNFSNEVCRNYEDGSISKDKWAKLKEFGYVPRSYDGEEFELEENVAGDGFTLDSQTFADIFMFICKLGNPTLEYKFVEEDNSINIGGYGLFP